jgi:hypothetical protein
MIRRQRRRGFARAAQTGFCGSQFGFGSLQLRGPGDLMGTQQSGALALKIADLAKKMITLSGRVPNKDIHIQYSGLRPGEKLFEELRSHLSGFVFFRKDETGFYIKSPKLDIIDKLVESNNLVEV